MLERLLMIVSDAQLWCLGNWVGKECGSRNRDCDGIG